MDYAAPLRAPQNVLKRCRAGAWLIILVMEAGLLVWGAMTAVLPARVPGPGGAPILAAGFENYTGQSWPEFATATPLAAQFIEMLFRLFGAYIVAFALLAIGVTVTAFREGRQWAWWMLLVSNAIAFGAPMTYDRIVGAIGPFELLEYVAVAAIIAALAVTTPGLGDHTASGVAPQRS